MKNFILLFVSALGIALATAADLPQSIDVQQRTAIQDYITSSSNYDPASVAITGGTISNTTVYGYSTVTPGSLGLQSSNAVDIIGGKVSVNVFDSGSNADAGTFLNGLGQWVMPTVSGSTYYLNGSVASDISTYKVLGTTLNSTTAINTNTFNAVTNGQYLSAFATPVGGLGTTVLPNGLYHVEDNIAFNTGGGRALVMKAEMYIRNAGGSEYIELPSSQQFTITGTQAAYEFDVYSPTNIIIAATDRLVVKMKVVSQTANPNVSLFSEGPTIAHLETPVKAASGGSSITLAGYECAIAPNDWHGWMPGYGSTVSNAAAPIYWSVTDAGLNETAFGFTSSDTATLQSRYAFATIKVPSYASGYKAGDNMVISVKTSTTSTVTNKLDFAMIMPGQAAFVTNGLVGATANGLTTITIPVASLPTFTHPNGITNATLRCDFQCFAGATAAVCHVMIPWQ